MGMMAKGAGFAKQHQKEGAEGDTDRPGMPSSGQLGANGEFSVPFGTGTAPGHHDTSGKGFGQHQGLGGSQALQEVKEK